MNSSSSKHRCHTRKPKDPRQPRQPQRTLASKSIPFSSSSSSSSSSTTVPEPTTFLFVVNELPIDPECELPTDQYLHYMPPLTPSSYLPELPGAVFRYTSGTITPAPNHIWYRPSPDGPGSIIRTDVTGTILNYPPIYKTQSVFSCSPHIPLIVLDSDASLGSTLRRAPCNCQATTDDSYSWRLLHFGHGNGVSIANASFSGQTWVAGRNPSWMPSLVPEVYRDPRATGASRGLSGDLGVVIGMMAFHGGVGRASEVFQSGKWWGHRWTGRASVPAGYPVPDEAPRGFVVQVCLDVAQDDEVGTQAAWERIEALEWNGILVEG